MALQPQVNVGLVYGVESVFGTQSAAAGKYLRRINSTLNLQKDAFTSNEVRPDLQVYDGRHGTRRGVGNIGGELSTKTWDDLMEAVLRGTWATGLTVTQATGAMSAATLAADNATSKFTASAGSFITAGIRVGDVVRIIGHNANINYRIRAINGTGRELTVSPAPTTNSAVGSWSVIVQGKKLVPGLVERSFSIEQINPQIDVSMLLLGTRFGDMNVGVAPNGMASIGFGVQAKDVSILSGAGSPVFASPTAAAASGLLTGAAGSASISGTSMGVITAFDFSLSNNLSAPPVVFANTVPEIFYGRIVVNGNISMLIEDAVALNYFNNETEINLSMNLNDSNGTDFLAFSFGRVKLMAGSQSVGPDGGVILQAPFQSFLSSGVSGFDDGSLTIQRSNLT